MATFETSNVFEPIQDRKRALAVGLVAWRRLFLFRALLSPATYGAVFFIVFALGLASMDGLGELARYGVDSFVYGIVLTLVGLVASHLITQYVQQAADWRRCVYELRGVYCVFAPRPGMMLVVADAGIFLVGPTRKETFCISGRDPMVAFAALHQVGKAWYVGLSRYQQRWGDYYQYQIDEGMLTWCRVPHVELPSLVKGLARVQASYSRMGARLWVHWGSTSLPVPDFEPPQASWPKVPPPWVLDKEIARIAR